MAAEPGVRLGARTTMAVLTTGVRALGPLRRPVAGIVGSIWYARLQPVARRRVAANHRRLAPALDARMARRRARYSYIEYVAMIMDSIWAEPLEVRQLERLVTVTGRQHLQAAPRGGVLAIAHFGNWDLAASGALALGVPLTTVMAPVGPPAITEMVALSRQRKGLELFTPREAARGLVRALQRGRWVALMMDVPEAGPTVTVEYCGGPVVVSAVPARLAAAQRVPVVPAACWREGGGWRLAVYRPIESVRGEERAVMSTVAAVLERSVREHPEQWYPFHEVYADGPG